MHVLRLNLSLNRIEYVMLFSAKAITYFYSIRFGAFMYCISSFCPKLINASTIVSLCIFSFPLLGGCSPQGAEQSQKETQKTASTPEPTTPSKMNASNGSALVVDGETYQIYYPSKPLNSTQGQQTIKVVPKPGYKVNQDFPHRIQVEPSETLKIKTPNLKGEITQTQLHYKVDVEGKNGKHSLQAKADFSICNESMCKLYRATPVEWTAHIQVP